MDRVVDAVPSVPVEERGGRERERERESRESSLYSLSILSFYSVSIPGLWHCALYSTYGADDIIRSRLNSPLFPSLPLLFLSLPLRLLLLLLLFLYCHHHHDCSVLSSLLSVLSFADSLLVFSFVTRSSTLPLDCLVYTLRYPTSSYHPP